jgi:hypothetical protein
MLNKSLIILLSFFSFSLFGQGINWKSVPGEKFILGETGLTLERSGYGDLGPGETAESDREDKYLYWGHEVVLDDFEMSEYEITVWQFRNFINETNYKYSFYLERNKHIWDLFEDDDQGIQYISFFDMLAYTQYLSLKTGENIRLCTEAEWELATKGNTQNRYPWGSDFKYVVDPNYKIKDLNRRSFNSIYLFEEDVSLYGIKGMFGGVATTLDVYSEDYFTRSAYYNPLNLEGSKAFLTLRGGADYVYDNEGLGILRKRKHEFAGRGSGQIRLVKTREETIFNKGQIDEATLQLGVASAEFNKVEVYKHPTLDSDVIEILERTEGVFTLYKTTKKEILYEQDDYWYFVAVDRTQNGKKLSETYLGWVK